MEPRKVKHEVAREIDVPVLTFVWQTYGADKCVAGVEQASDIHCRGRHLQKITSESKYMRHLFLDVSHILQILFVSCYPSRHVYRAPLYRDLQNLIEAMQDASSPFNRSYLYTTTDSAVYSSPSSPGTKKRKRSPDDSEGVRVQNDVSAAKPSDIIVANKQVKKVCIDYRAKSCWRSLRF